MSKIYLDRVVFRDPINVPGASEDVYATHERIVASKERPNNRLSSKQHFTLWHDSEFVFVQHPERPESQAEKVPMANILQMRETPVTVEKKK